MSDRVLHGVTDRPGAKNLSQHSQYLCNFATLSPQHGVSLADSQHAIRLAIPAKTWSVIGCFRKYTYAGLIYLFKKIVAILTILRYEKRV
jgi:hypothetical protein